jgi:uncharacterized protein (TIGR00369 family)
MTPSPAPDPESFPPLPDHRAATWARFGRGSTPIFPTFVGLVVEDIRTDYCRMRLPYRPELDQPAGFVHGGALATLIDTVVVPAVGAGYDEVPVMLTLSMNISYVGAVRQEDAIAHGWIVRRGRSVVFCDAVVLSDGGALAATGSLVYSVRPAPTA